MSLTELHYFHLLDEATTFAEVDRLVAEAEGFGHWPTIALHAEGRKRELMDAHEFDLAEGIER